MRPIVSGLWMARMWNHRRRKKFFKNLEKNGYGGPLNSDAYMRGAHRPAPDGPWQLRPGFDAKKHHH